MTETTATTEPARIHSGDGADEDQYTYIVLKNEEEQYSLWREEIEVPAGWAATGFRGSRQECMDHVDEVWTDLRPKSAREAIDRKWAELAAAENQD